MIRRFVSGRVDIRLDERTVIVGGLSTGLGSRATDLLEVMIDRRDRVMTKDELLDAAWPGLVVEENNLQVQVSNLRKVLGKSSIATIPGRGYRFTLAFDGLPAAAHTQPTANQHPSGLPLRRSTIVGREKDVEGLRAALGNHPLVTVVRRCRKVGAAPDRI
jgi:DNA-binding winged helix-turn-helix (wHTH) protein